MRLSSDEIEELEISAERKARMGEAFLREAEKDRLEAERLRQELKKQESADPDSGTNT